MPNSPDNKIEPSTFIGCDTAELLLCQQELSNKIKEAIADQSFDPTSFTKQILISKYQLNSLQNGTVAGFYTYGLYLCALRRAINCLGLNGDTDIEAKYAKLVQHHNNSPKGQQIIAVQKVVNKKLGKFLNRAPEEEEVRLNWRFQLATIFIFLLIAGLTLGLLSLFEVVSI